MEHPMKIWMMEQVAALFFLVKPPYHDVRNGMDRNGLQMSMIPAGTAQGGGGSFKDRKPIGEVRCCESWMAEQIY